jgi:hypothetical protein
MHKRKILSIFGIVVLKIVILYSQNIPTQIANKVNLIHNLKAKMSNINLDSIFLIFLLSLLYLS